MTGEITLSGSLLPVSGVQEKLLAAQRAGVKTVILPLQNQVDVNNVEEEGRKGLEIALTDEIIQILDVVLLQSIG
jgi:ATP-dependent Lon protease